jgi:hypothetical protein
MSESQNPSQKNDWDERPDSPPDEQHGPAEPNISRSATGFQPPPAVSSHEATSQKSKDTRENVKLVLEM